MDPVTVLSNKYLGRFFAEGFAGAGHSAGKHNACSHPFDVPLPRPANGLVEIIDVDHDFRSGRGEETEIFDMRVTAKLNFDLRILGCGEVSRHDPGRSAKESKRRSTHEAELDRQ